MSRGFVALVLVVALVLSGGVSALVSSAVTSAALSTEQPAGPVGETGPAGADGIDGVDGADGEPGATGADGADGPRGAAGAAGPRGARGPAGADGADGADAVLASVAVTVPDGPVSYPGGSARVALGPTFSVDAAPLVLVAWQATIEAPSPFAFFSCGLRDTETDTIYGTAGVFVEGSPGSLVGSALVNLSGGDADLEISCFDGHETAQQWTVTDASALALTLGT